MSENVKDVTDKNFESEVLKSDQPVLVDFWAAWCQPCRALAPAVEAVAKQYEGKAKIFKLNVDDYNQIAVQYQVRGIPTLIVFKGGKEAQRVTGLTTKENISRMLDIAIGAGAASS